MAAASNRQVGGTRITMFTPSGRPGWQTGWKEIWAMSSPRLEIIERYCKGCSICVEFCPTHVLEMDGFLATVVRPEACIGCMQCELRCPDFAIKVYKE
jgi:2-oxoglutarate ferredoxin oxidoreductase subunit delta